MEGPTPSPSQFLEEIFFSFYIYSEMELYDGCSSVICSFAFFFFLAECFGHFSMLVHGKDSQYLVHTTPLNRYSITQLTNFMEHLKSYYIYIYTKQN